MANYYNDVKTADEDGDTYLFVSIIWTELALQLIDRLSGYEQLSHANNMGQTALHLAVITGNVKVTRRLVVAGSPLNYRDKTNGDTPLHIACRNGREDLVKAIVEPVRYLETKTNGYDVPYRMLPFGLKNYDGKTCLLLACEIRNGRDVILCLINRGANIEERDGKSGRTCIHVLVERGDSKTIDEVMKHTPRSKVYNAMITSDWSGNTPLETMCCCMYIR